MGKNEPKPVEKNAELLSASEQQYRTLIEIQRTGVLVHQDFEIVFANQSAVRMFGADSVEDLLGRTSLELTHPDFHKTLTDRRRQLEETHEPQDFIELIHIRLDGSEFYSIDNAAPIEWDNESAVLVSVSDISELKKAEKAVAESEKRFRDFTETAADRFWETDTEHRFTFISPPMYPAPHFEGDALIGKKRWELPILNTDSPGWKGHLNAIDAHQSFRNFHFQVKQKDGTVRHFVSSGRPKFDDDGNFMGYRGTTDEETEQILAEDKIAGMQQQFFTAIENFSDGFALWDENRRFVYCNSYFRLSHPTAQKFLLPGEKYEDFIRAFATTTQVEPKDGIDEWVNCRIDEFEEESSTVELHRNDQWVQIRKHKLSNGSTMVLYTDITELKAREDALRESENRLHLITDAMPAMIAYHDQDLRFQFANKNFETIGLDSEEIIGKRIQDVFPPETTAAIWPYIQKTLAGEPVNYDNFFPGEDGTDVYTQVSLIPDFDDAGDVQGLFVLSLDITERKIAQAEMEKNKAALDTAQSIAKIGSWEGKFATQTFEWSDEHYRIFGVKPNTVELTFDWFLSMVHPDDRERMRALSHEISATDTHHTIDFRIIRPDGSERFIHGVVEALFDQQQNLIGMRGTSQDITEQKRNEEALEQARREAEFANKAKSEFLSSMSHELRTPMNAILGYAQLLLQTKKDPLQGRQTKQVNQILVSGQHLLKLINDILDLAKIESGRIAFELSNIDITEPIEECVSLIASLAERNNIEIKLIKPSPSSQLLMADRTRFKQAFLNLLSNAIKYNKPGGSVTISSQLTDDNKIRISVEDTGIGIPEDRHEEIFEPFSRLGAEQKGIEGTGIGLTITKQLVDLMDGKIGFSSTFDVGSIFWIEFLAPSGDKAPSTQQPYIDDPVTSISDDLESTVYKLLYIEDDTSNLHLMEELIDNIQNIDLLSAISAEDGLESARENHPDIIFMDINLPGMSGLEAMAILQDSTETKDIPVIALSAAAMPHDIEKGREAGFYNYLTKPFDISEVLTNVNEALKPGHKITYGKKSN
ncbi:MAG: PAS domain S-box protein [Rhodospirillaceae bacterium]|nr:PAS domain S-box protein [Rhodospirillaceae bacterium]MBT5939057.1 PAS domain S-box protein [Rhodospirillaceae bacterium]